jgi:hypothetical protein
MIFQACIEVKRTAVSPQPSAFRHQRSAISFQQLAVSEELGIRGGTIKNDTSDAAVADPV